MLVFFKSIDQHFRHLQTFIHVMEKNGLAASASKMILFQTNIRFLAHDIYQGTMKPIQRSSAFADKFPDEIKDRKQLQRFFFPKLRQKCAPPLSKT